MILVIRGNIKVVILWVTESYYKKQTDSLGEEIVIPQKKGVSPLGQQSLSIKNRSFSLGRKCHSKKFLTVALGRKYHSKNFGPSP